MLDNTIYVKTPKGQNEIATRAQRLPLRPRRLLILVDGQTDGRSLIGKAALLGDTPDVFEQLVVEGYIVPVDALDTASASVPASSASGATPSASAAGSSAVLPRGPVSARRSLALARLYLVEAMARMLGKEGDTLRDALRSATTRAALLEHLEVCLEIVAETSGPERAQDLKAKVLELMPLE